MLEIILFVLKMLTVKTVEIRTVAPDLIPHQRSPLPRTRWEILP
jgi:hypothetical protein